MRQLGVTLALAAAAFCALATGARTVRRRSLVPVPPWPGTYHVIAGYTDTRAPPCPPRVADL